MVGGKLATSVLSSLLLVCLEILVKLFFFCPCIFFVGIVV